MKKRRGKNVSRVIRITPQANAWLNQRAEELGLSGAEYSRRLMFLEAYAGLVFDDVRAIEAAAIEAVNGQPVEAWLPYMKNAIERLRHGKEEVRQLRAFVVESILPALEEAERKIGAVLQMKDEEAQTWRGIDELSKLTNKLSGELPK